MRVATGPEHDHSGRRKRRVLPRPQVGSQVQETGFPAQWAWYPQPGTASV
jgi:hypothetical protein